MDEIIKNILKKLESQYAIQLSPKGKRNWFVLKTSGFKEYFCGNQPMLNYDRVRINLRGLRSLQVTLTEIDSSSQRERALPIIRRKQNFNFAVDKEFVD